jgi:hypothetical protein
MTTALFGMRLNLTQIYKTLAKVCNVQEIQISLSKFCFN